MKNNRKINNYILNFLKKDIDKVSIIKKIKKVKKGLKTFELFKFAIRISQSGLVALKRRSD